MGSNIRMTVVVAKVLRQFLDDLDEPRYGTDLMRATGLPSGTLYPILAKLEREEWLISEREDIDPKVERRPPRRYYKLNPAMAETARYEVATLAQALSAPSERRLHRPGLAGGVG